MPERPPSTRQLKDTVKEYLKIIDSGRFDDLLPILSDQIVYQTIGPSIQGPFKLVQYYKDTRLAGHGSHEVTGLIAEGSQVVALLRMKAEMRDGTAMEFNAVDVFSFESGKVVGVRTYSDLPPAVPRQAFAASRDSQTSA